MTPFRQQRDQSALRRLTATSGWDGYITSLLAAWRNCGGKLFVHFNNCGLYDNFGLWDTLEYLEQRRSDAPKFDCDPDIHRQKSDLVVAAPAILSMKFEVLSFNAKKVWETILIVHLPLIGAIAYLRRIKHV